MSRMYEYKNLRAIRQQRGLGQTDLANATGIPQQAISAYERGDRSPRLDAIDRLADVLEVHPGELLYGTARCIQDTVDGAEIRYVTKRERKLIDVFRNVDEGTQEKILIFLCICA